MTWTHNLIPTQKLFTSSFFVGDLIGSSYLVYSKIKTSPAHK